MMVIPEDEYQSHETCLPDCTKRVRCHRLASRGSIPFGRFALRGRILFPSRAALRIHCVQISSHFRVSTFSGSDRIVPCPDHGFRMGRIRPFRGKPYLWFSSRSADQAPAVLILDRDSVNRTFCTRSNENFTGLCIYQVSEPRRTCPPVPQGRSTRQDKVAQVTLVFPAHS